jgi:hypothetical protein
LVAPEDQSTTHPFEVNYCDWVITNPPFRLGEDFIHRAPRSATGRRCDAYSESLDRRSENIRVLPVIVAELELGDIERHIFAAHFVECANDATLEDRPKTFDSLGVDCADDILASGMVNDAMRIFAVKPFVAAPLIGAKQADFVRDCWTKAVRVLELIFATTRATTLPLRLTAPTIGVLLEPMPPVPPPLPGLSQCRFLAKPPTKVSSTSTMPPSLSIFHKSDRNLMAHHPRGAIGTKAHIAVDFPARLPDRVSANTRDSSLKLTA